MVMSKIPTVEFAHAVEVAREMAKVAKKYRLEEYASCVLAELKRAWSVSEENMEDFLETYLEFAIALRICRAESKPSYALFQTHRRLMADVAEDHDTDVETFLNVLHSSHMPSGYQRLMSMIVQSFRIKTMMYRAFCLSMSPKYPCTSIGKKNSWASCKH